MLTAEISDATADGEREFATSIRPTGVEHWQRYRHPSPASAAVSRIRGQEANVATAKMA